MKSVLSLFFVFAVGLQYASAADRPNILIAISDDVSWPHKSAYGNKMVSSPAFDSVAKNGVLFSNAFAASPGCSPSRAAFLTGRHTWQIEHAGTHASYFHKKYVSFPDELESAGYFSGYVGKGWGPGNWKKFGYQRNPAGAAFSSGKAGYVGGFKKFMQARPDGKPFCFWFGSHDAHRSYKKGSGLKKGKTLAQATVPSFLPDREEVRSDLLDYAFEIERFDSDLQQMLDILRDAGEIQNTLVIVTSDNGMPFPRAKANCYEMGIHMPLAIQWPARIPSGRVVDDLVGFVDLTATIYEAANVPPPTAHPLSGRSILKTLASKQSGLVDKTREAVFAARERHSSSRYNTLGYPQRCIRTDKFLLVHNFKPERWPAGPAEKFQKARFENGKLVESVIGPKFGGYHDIDACPTLSFLTQNHADPEIARYLELAVAKRPMLELFDIKNDPGCLKNLATLPSFETVAKDLDARLLAYLRETGDPRATGHGDLWETYPRVSGIRWFPEPEWVKTESVPELPWLEARKPKR